MEIVPPHTTQRSFSPEPTSLLHPPYAKVIAFWGDSASVAKLLLDGFGRHCIFLRGIGSLTVSKADALGFPGLGAKQEEDEEDEDDEEVHLPRPEEVICVMQG